MLQQPCIKLSHGSQLILYIVGFYLLIFSYSNSSRLCSWERLVCSFLSFFRIYFWLCWAFLAVWAFLPLWQTGVPLHLWCTGFSLRWLPLLRSTGCRAQAHVVHGLSRSVACGIFPDRRSNLCPLQWHMGSSPLYQQGGSLYDFCCFKFVKVCLWPRMWYGVSLWIFQVSMRITCVLLP